MTEPVLDEDGNLLDTKGELIDPSKRSKKKQVPATEEVFYYLLHWGLTYEILIDYPKPGEVNKYPVTYTIGICQHLKTGEIKTFIPAELTVVGREMK